MAGPVALSVSGQPSGSTATFTPASTTAASTLTIKTSTSTTRRTYTLTIKGVDGSVSHTTNVSLTVTR